ncbi:MAG TPA: non-reducing end alpha-L-arabinofuranosidase family hydrolase, partial [Gammaproteobacteria bacterium]|nr:non-reducing end alpha-L-arabinofuranosidase family hydrolase [Gammaproteobacteria bacterium]
MSPKNGNASVKDPTIVNYGGKYHVFATVYNNGWKSIYLNFTDFSQASAASHTNFQPGGSYTVA